MGGGERALLEFLSSALVPDGDNWFEGVFVSVQQEQRRAKGQANERLIGQRQQGIEHGRGRVGEVGAGAMKHVKLVGGARHEDECLHDRIGLERTQNKRHAIRLIQPRYSGGEGHLLQSALPGFSRGQPAAAKAQQADAGNSGTVRDGLCQGHV